MENISIPLPNELKDNFPSFSVTEFIKSSRLKCRNILSGKDSRKVFIVGPCSIHDQESTMDYAMRLKRLAEEVSDNCVLIMRVYIEKSRTSKGWKGFLYDPHLDKSNAIKTGLEWSRKLLLKLAQLGIPCATEFVNPLIAPYFEDLITWGFIGARATYSQTHRQLASCLSMPIGFKNSLDGSLKSAIHAVESAEESHIYLSVDSNGKLGAIQTPGNPDTHIVLRGSCHTTNYDSYSIQQALDLLSQHDLPQRILIDCSHGNAQKLHSQQNQVFENTLDQVLKGNDKIFGWMIESHLKEGNQSLHAPLKYGVSITDPCLDWNNTERLIRAAHLALSASLT